MRCFNDLTAQNNLAHRHSRPWLPRDPLSVSALQAPRTLRLAYCSLYRLHDPEVTVLLEALRQGLREQGYVEGQNLSLTFRFAEGRAERLPDLARELVQLQPDLIIAGNTLASVQPWGTSGLGFPESNPRCVWATLLVQVGRPWMAQYRVTADSARTSAAFPLTHGPERPKFPLILPMRPEGQFVQDGLDGGDPILVHVNREVCNMLSEETNHHTAHFVRGGSRITVNPNDVIWAG
jgi:hypothetical protein